MFKLPVESAKNYLLSLMRGNTMNWIDDYLAVSDLGTGFAHRRKYFIFDAVIDVRVAFSYGEGIVTIPDPNILRGLVLSLVTASKSKRKTLIHCMAGIDRAPFVAALYRMRMYGEDFDMAYDTVKKLHPQTFQHWEWKYIAEKPFYTSIA